MLATSPSTTPSSSASRPIALDRLLRKGLEVVSPSPQEVWTHLGKVVVWGALAWLALLHGQLLWQRIANLTLFEPWVALRWSAAALLLAAFAYLQRSGISVVWGHKALVIWLLVLLCHAGVAIPIEGHQLLAEPGVLFAISLWGFALRAILGESDLVALPAPALRHGFASGPPPGRPRGLAFFEPLSPRPPPAR